MHQKRHELTTKLPLQRKGTKYVARASSHINNSVPVVFAVRDILNLARNLKEVEKMIQQGLLEINGKKVRNYKESIRLFNIFKADKDYVLSLLPTGKFTFKESKDKNKRLCKITGKKILSGKKIQLNFHDGTNVLSDKDYPMGDSVYLDFSGKIKEHISLEKGKSAFVISGKYAGSDGKIESTEGKIVNLKINDKEEPVTLSRDQVAVYE